MRHALRIACNALMVVALAGGLSGCSYNRFTSQEEAIKSTWAEVQNQLQRRNDLIPNLVETVEGYANQERDIFIAIAESRSRLMNAKTPEEQVEAANAQSSALARLLAIVENYPQLKSDANFQRLMDELAGTEGRIAVARRRYNEPVQQYNTLRRSFPSNVTAKVWLQGVPVLRSAPRRTETAESGFQQIDGWPSAVTVRLFLS